MSGPELLGGRYELRGVLGLGGMAEVRDGWDNRLGRAVAIKLLRPGLSVDLESRRRFEAEARSAAALGDRGWPEQFRRRGDHVLPDDCGISNAISEASRG